MSSSFGIDKNIEEVQSEILRKMDIENPFSEEECLRLIEVSMLSAKASTEQYGGPTWAAAVILPKDFSFPVGVWEKVGGTPEEFTPPDQFYKLVWINPMQLHFPPIAAAMMHASGQGEQTNLEDHRNRKRLLASLLRTLAAFGTALGVLIITPARFKLMSRKELEQDLNKAGVTDIKLGANVTLEVPGQAYHAISEVIPDASTESGYTTDWDPEEDYASRLLITADVEDDITNQEEFRNAVMVAKAEETEGVFCRILPCNDPGFKGALSQFMDMLKSIGKGETIFND